MNTDTQNRDADRHFIESASEEVARLLTENAQLRAELRKVTELASPVATRLSVLTAQRDVALVILNHAVERGGKDCLPELLSASSALKGMVTND